MLRLRGDILNTKCNGELMKYLGILLTLALLTSNFHKAFGMLCCTKSSVQIIEQTPSPTPASSTIQDPKRTTVHARKRRAFFSPFIAIHEQTYELSKDSQVETKRRADSAENDILCEKVTFAHDANTLEELNRMPSEKHNKKNKYQSDFALFLFLEYFDLKIQTKCAEKNYETLSRVPACYLILDKLRLFDNAFFLQQTAFFQKRIILAAFTAIDYYLTNKVNTSKDIKDINVLKNILVDYDFVAQREFYTFEPTRT
jgi:hypothetical protein